MSETEAPGKGGPLKALAEQVRALREQIASLTAQVNALEAQRAVRNSAMTAFGESELEKLIARVERHAQALAGLSHNGCIDYLVERGEMRINGLPPADRQRVIEANKR